jgi:hypothetical protein
MIAIALWVNKANFSAFETIQLNFSTSQFGHCQGANWRISTQCPAAG